MHVFEVTDLPNIGAYIFIGCFCLQAPEIPPLIYFFTSEL